jgi:SCY1-like protein 2
MEGYANTISTLFSSASAALGRTGISSNYTLASASASTSTNSTAVITIGVWTVERATHNISGKHVSVWSCDKSRLSVSSGRTDSRKLEKTLEILRKEATSLARLRHPSILEVAEPIEENR